MGLIEADFDQVSMNKEQRGEGAGSRLIYNTRPWSKWHHLRHL